MDDGLIEKVNDFEEILLKIKNARDVRREQKCYIVVGIITAIIHFGVFQCLLFLLRDYIIANVVTHLVSKIIAYGLNKQYVFCTGYNSFFNTVKEFFKFLIARGITGIIDFLGVILFVEIFNFSPMVSKIFFIIVCVLINYLFSKYYIFKEIR